MDKKQGGGAVAAFFAKPTIAKAAFRKKQLAYYVAEQSLEAEEVAK